VLPSMVERRQGKILNIASVAGKRGDFIGNAHYTAAKAGMMGLTRSLAAYAAPHGVNVNALAPGIVDTELTRATSAEHKATTLSRIPIGRFAALEEIAAVARFLVSDAASYVVGETVSVNGGSYMD
jgi:3-oxoacyl-[acyl-carrier protein] reductase